MIFLNNVSVLSIFTSIIFLASVTQANKIVKSVQNFKDKLSNFFYIEQYIKLFNDFQPKIETRRQKIKNAFKQFVTEAFYEKPKNKTILRSGNLAEDETKMLVTKLIVFHGYQAETHNVQTRDGYVLNIQRILPVSPKSVKGKEKLVLLHHGLMGSSEDWLVLGPGRALPYLLSDSGYDVWLTNSRGTKYSRFDYNYVNLEPYALWDFSFHEIGHFDLSAVIDYIQSRNKNELEINFVGHSLGGTALLVLLSTLPQYNNVLNSATLLAPLAFLSEIKGPFKLLAEFYKANGRDSLNFLGENEFMAKQNFPRQFIEKFCKGDLKLCTNPLLFLTSGGKIEIETDLLGNLLDRAPSKASMKTIIHYLQLINTGKFQNFDYGESENLKKYGVATAPSYDLSKIVLPIILFSAQKDWLCTKTDMNTLVHSLSNVITNKVITNPDFGHTDFVWGKKAPISVYQNVLDILENYNFSKRDIIG